MKSKRFVAHFMLVLIIFSTVGIVNAQDGLTIGTQVQAFTVGVEETTYEPGESVEIYGAAGSLANVSIMVFDGYTYILDLNVTAKEDGEYEVELDLPEDAENGTYTVTASTDGESIQAYFYVMVQDLEELAENLISHAEDSQESVEDVFEALEAGGIDISSVANESYNLGVEALAAALTHFEDGNYTEAGEYAHDAVELFWDAYTQVQGLIPIELADGDDDDDDEADEESLAVAIDRAFAYWAKLNDTVTRLEGEAYNVAGITEVLDEAHDKLEAASGELLAGNHTGAVEEFRTAQSVLGRIHGYLQSTVKEHKQKKAEQFVEQFQRRIQDVNGTLLRLQERLEEGVTARVRGVLTSSMNRLQQLRRRMAAGMSSDDLEDALDELEDTVEDIEDGIEGLGRNYASQIKSMNQVEAKIRVLNKTARRLADKGKDISGFEGEMDDAEGLLAQLRERFQAGNIEDIGDLLDDAKDSFKKAKKRLQEDKFSEIKERIATKIQEQLQFRRGMGGNSTGGP
jgi:ABC-type transporter Mla subunit MlaD